MYGARSQYSSQGNQFSFENKFKLLKMFLIFLMVNTYNFFRTPHQNQCPPQGAPPTQKWTPPLKHETPFREMIPRKSTINNNLKSSYIPWKICVKKFIFSKFGGLRTYSWQLYYQMNSFTGIFQQYFKLPHAPPMFRLKSPNQKPSSTPVGNPALIGFYIKFTVSKLKSNK